METINCIKAPCPGFVGGTCASLPPNLRSACEAAKNKATIPTPAKAQLGGVNWPLIGILAGVGVLMFFLLKN